VRILVAPDKFKGSLGAADVAAEIAAGLRDKLRNIVITQLPVADGGEGTAEAICAAAGGDWYECEVRDALAATVRARYCVTGGNAAVIDASSACGLSRIPFARRNPDVASSFGVGELLLDAAQRGVRKIIIGLGGTATNDGGVGMARALGFRFLDQRGDELRGAVSELKDLARIAQPWRIDLPEIIAAADVRNPLLGPPGATQVFAEQKGATTDRLEVLERALQRLADVAASHLSTDVREAAGAGAAGGLGFGLMSFCGATLRRGFDVVAEYVRLEAAVREHDVIVTGEGRLDAQTLEGKAPAGVAELARKHQKRVYAIVGQLAPAAGVSELFDAIYALTDSVAQTAVATRDPRPLLRQRARELADTLRH
jgi:glycerate kinase